MISFNFKLVPGDMVRVRNGEESIVIFSDFHATISVEISDNLDFPVIGEAKKPSL